MRNDMSDDNLQHSARDDAEQDREQQLLAEAKPCPFCGSRTLTVGWWCLSDEDTEAIECAQCYAGAPFKAWQRRASSGG